MEIGVKGRKFQFENEVRNHKKIRNSFLKLAKEIFALDFNPWYEQGYWTENYKPYVILDGDEVVANISVNQFHSTMENENIHLIQLGTVMTQESYRNLGLSRWLMEYILKEWKDTGIFLFANDRVLDFYPKFGFEKRQECQFVMENTKLKLAEKLEVTSLEDLKFIESAYGLGNRNAKFPMEGNFGLLMFYLTGPLKESIYRKDGGMIIADLNEHETILYDMFGNIELEDIIERDQENSSVSLGFTPKDGSGLTKKILQEDDTTLFVKNMKLTQDCMFPLLSRA